ncbi:MAG: alpha/beta fold hydrolase [Tannerella sp.]|jgi:pimeloyl-ACP methyl ester carboxylesterase|nr:alpha/beta fold hydrolase [Tannerella sp.]
MIKKSLFFMMNGKIKENRLKSYILLFFTAFCMFFITGCSDKNEPPTNPEIPEQPENPGEPDTPENVTYEILKEYSFGELKNVEKNLAGNALVFPNIIGNQAKYEGDVQMRAYKVMLKTDHPDGSAARINLSGLLIVPPSENGRKYRQVIAPPYTYIMKNEAPTLRIADDRLDPHLMFWLLEAYNYGYAVMIPDYPGFGDSYGQCFIPYLDKKAMVRTTSEYVEAARSVLEKEKYEKKDGFIISGYSLGAYVSLLLTHEFETNASNNMDVDLLIVGGAPCNLLQEANMIRSSSTMPQPYLFPLALLGYKKNAYPHLRINDYLREPYASESAVYLDGEHDYWDFFTNNTSDLFTENFLKNNGMDGMNKILDDNSAKPWKNRCEFIMTHGLDDKTVYYEQAKDFADEQKKYGGSVSFGSTAGTHTDAGVWFFLRLYVELGNFN